MSTIARVYRPRSARTNLDISNVYAKSPYRPYSGFFADSYNVSTQQYQDSLINAISLFSINDQNVIEAIRRQNNIKDDGSYALAQDVGGVMGTAVGIGISAAKFAPALITLGKGLMSGYATANPIGVGVGIAGSLLTIAGTIMTSRELGRILGASVGSREGSIAMQQYVRNLGNSMVNRPVSAALNALTIAGTRFLTRKIPSPFARQFITMASMRALSPVGQSIDNELFGVLDDRNQFTYTTLLTLQGDLSDNFDGTSFVKAGLVGALKGEDAAKDLIAKMYGTHEEGFDPLDFADVREAYGVDMGTFSNGLIDILGEVVFDVGNNVEGAKNRVNRTIAKSITKDMWSDILVNEDGFLFKRYFEKIDGKIVAKSTFKNEFGDKKLTSLVENYLEKYKDPALAKNLEEQKKIETKNASEIIVLNQNMYMYLVDKGLKNLPENKRAEEATKISLSLLDMVLDKLKLYSPAISKHNKNKKEYAEAVNKLVDAQKETYKKVNEGFKNNLFNFDTALLKELEGHEFEISRDHGMKILYSQPALRAHVLAVNQIMRVTGFLTRPVQSILSLPGVRSRMKKVLGRKLRVFDPFKKQTTVDDLIFANAKDLNLPITKEQNEEIKKQVKEQKKDLKKTKLIQDQAEYRLFLGDNEEFEATVKKLNDILEKYKYYEVKEEERILLEEEKSDLKEVLKKYKDLLKNSRKEMKSRNKSIFIRSENSMKKMDKKYAAMKIKEDEAEERAKDYTIEYDSDGVKTKVKIKDDTDADFASKQIEEMIQNGEDKSDPEKFEALKMGLLFFRMNKTYEGQYKDLTSAYNEIIDLMQLHSETFERDYALFLFLINETQVLNPSKEDKKILEEKQTEVKPKLEKDIIDNSIEDMKKRFLHDVVTIGEKTKEEKIFASDSFTKAFGQFKRDFKEKKLVSIKKYFATDVFTVLKEAKGKEASEKENILHFNNNPELFEMVENALNTKEINIHLRNLFKDIETSPNKAGRKLNKPISRQRLMDLKSIVKERLKIAFSNVTDVDKGDLEKLIKDENLEKIVLKMAITKTYMKKNSKEKGGESMKLFSKMSDNDIKEYLFNLYVEHMSGFKGLGENIDNQLRFLQVKLNILKDVFVNENNIIEKEFHAHVQQKMSKIKESNIIKAISAKYLKFGDKELFYQIGITQKMSVDNLDEKQLEEIKNLIKNDLQEAKSEQQREEIFKKIKDILVEGFEKHKEMMDLFDFNEDFFKEVLEESKEVKEEIKQEKYELNKVEKFVSTMKTKVLDVIKQNNGKELSSEEEKSLNIKIEKELNELIIRYHNDKFRKQKEEDITKRQIALANRKIVLTEAIAFLNETGFSTFFKPEDFRKVMRGKHNAPNTRIDLERSRYRDSIIKYMIENEPSLKTVAELKSLPFGFFRTYSGKAVDLQRISQIDQKFIPKKWKDFMYGKIDTELNKEVTDFLRYSYSGENKETKERFIFESHTLPQKIREFFLKKKNQLKDNDFLKEEQIETEIMDSIAKDLFNELIFRKIDKKRIQISKVKEVEGNKIRVIRIYLGTVGQREKRRKDYVEVFIPEATKENVYDIYQKKLGKEELRQNRYIKLRTENNRDYLSNVVRTIEKEIKETYMYHKKMNKEEVFTAFEAQQETFLIFNKQRYLEVEDQFITDFNYYDPSRHGDLTEFILLQATRQTDYEKDLIEDDYELYLRKMEEENYSKDVVQSDPKIFFNKIQTAEGLFSITEILNPLMRRTEVSTRPAHTTKALANALKTGTEEEPIVNSAIARDNPHLNFKYGFNMKTLLMDVIEMNEVLKLEGVTTFESAAVMSQSAVKKYFNYEQTEDTKGHVNGYKIIDRHSGKFSISVISDAEMKRLSDGRDTELIISKDQVSGRGINAVRDELAISKEFLKDKKERESIYLTKQEAEKKAIELGGSDDGYLYLALTDDLFANEGKGYKFAGDHGGEGAKISTEEWPMFNNLSLIFNDEKMKKLSEYWQKKGIKSFSQEDLKSEIFGNERSLLGKRGKLRKAIEKTMPNSLYGKIMPDMSLKKDQIKLGQKAALDMGIAEEKIVDKRKVVVLKDDKGCKYVLLHRYPHQGRRSFAHLEVLIDNDNPGSRVINVNPWMVTPQNADFDGDGSAVFSYKGATKDILNLSKKAFTHDYENNTPLDMSKEEAQKISTHRSYKEVTKLKNKELDPNHVLEDKDFDDVPLRQAILKRYSAYLKDVFDSQIWIHDLNKANIDWFKNEFIEYDLNKKDGKKIYKTFYGLITELYEFYSQKTFDFSKHGSTVKAEIFKAIHQSIKDIQKEDFKTNIMRTVAILEKDKELSDKLEKDIEGKDRKQIKKIEQVYAHNMLKEIEEINKKFPVVIEESKEVLETEGISTQEMKIPKGRKNKAGLKDIKNFLEEKVSDLVKRETNNRVEKIDLDKILKSKLNPFTKINKDFLEEGTSFDLDGFTLQGNRGEDPKIKQIFQKIEQKEKLKGADNIVKTLDERLDQELRNFAAKVLRRLDATPEELMNIKIILVDRSDQQFSISFTELFKLRSDEDMYFFSPDRANASHFIKINPKIFKDPNIKSFHVEDRSGMNSGTMNRLSSELFRALGKTIVDSLNDLGYDQSNKMHPLMHNKIVYQTKLLEDLYISLVGEETKVGGSNLANILNRINEVDSIDKIRSAMKPFFTFQYIAEFVEGEKRTNIFKHIYEIEGIFEDKKVEEKDLITLKESLEEAGMFHEKMTMENFYKVIEHRLIEMGVIKKFANEQEKLEYANKFYAVLEEINSGITKDYNTVSQFKNETSFNDKINFITKIIEIRKADFLEGNRYGLDKEDLNNNGRSVKKEINTEVFLNIYEAIDIIKEKLEMATELSGEEREKLQYALDKEKEVFNLTDIVIRKINERLQMSRYSFSKMISEKDKHGDYIARRNLTLDNTRENFFLRTTTKKNKAAQNFEFQLNKIIYEDFGFDVDSPIGRAIKEEIEGVKGFKDVSLGLYYNHGRSINDFIDQLQKAVDNEEQFYIVGKKKLQLFLNLNKMARSLDLGVAMPGDFLTNMKELKQSTKFTDSFNHRSFYRLFYNDYLMNLNNKNEKNEIEKTMREFLNFFEGEQRLRTFNMTPEHFLQAYFGNLLFKKEVFDTKNLQDKKSLLEISNEIKDKFRDLINKNEEIRKLERERTSHDMMEKTLEIEEDDKVTLKFLKELTGIEDEGELKKLQEEVLIKRKEIKEAEAKQLKENTEQKDTYSLLRTEVLRDKDGNKLDIKGYNLYNAINRISGGKYIEEKTLVNEAVKRIKSKDKDITVNKIMHSALVDAEITLMAIEKLIGLGKKGLSSVEKEYQDFFKDFKNLKKRSKFVIFDTENIVSKRNNNRIYEISFITFDKNGEPIYHQHFLKDPVKDERTIRWLKREGFKKRHIEYILKKQKEKNYFGYNKEIFEGVMKEFEGKKMIGHAIRNNKFGDGDIQKINYEYMLLHRKGLQNLFDKYQFRHEADVTGLEKLDYKEVAKKASGKTLTKSKHVEIAFDIYKAKFLKDLQENILFNALDPLTEEQKQVYIERMQAISDAFLRYENFDDITKSLQDDVLKYMDKEYLKKVFELYQQRFQELISSEKPLGTPIPKIEFDKETGKYLIGWNRHEEIKIKSVEYDEYDVYSVVLFKQAAFYDALEFVKEMVRVNEITYGKYQFLKSEKNDKVIEEKFIKDDELKDDLMVKYQEEFDRFEKEDNELGALITYNKMLRRQEQLGEKIGENDAFIKDLLANKDDLDKMLKEEKHLGRIANTPQWELESMISDYYKNKHDKLYESKSKDNNFLNSLKIFINRLQIFGRGQEITIDDFAKTIDMYAKDPVVKVFHNEYLKELKRIKKKGIKITLKGDEEDFSIIKYKEGNEEVFIQNAFYNVVFNKQFNFDKIIKNEESNKIPLDQDKENELNAIHKKRIERKKENPENKKSFAEAREKVFDWMIKGDWDALKKYLKDKPNNEKDKSIDDIKKEFEDNYNRLVKEGLDIYEEVFHFDTNSNKIIEQFKKTGSKKKFIKGNKIYEDEFKRRAITSMFETINESILYIDSHITTMSDKPLSEKLTYFRYSNRLEEYDGKYINESEVKNLERDKKINKAYEYVSSRTDRTSDLSKYQIPFKDVIEYFKSKTDGRYDLDTLYRELTFGSLGKIYKVTIITDVSEKEKKFISDKLNKIKPGDEVKRTAPNRKYDEEKLNKLRNEYPEFKNEKEIFDASTIDFMEKMRDTEHPTLKVIDFSTNKNKFKLEFEELIRLNESGNIYLGFTTLNNLFNTDKISYESYRLPKPIAWVQSTIIQTQKMLMLMNFGFPVRNLIDGFQKNYHLILGRGNILEQNKNFMNEIKRSWDLFFKFRAQNTVHLKEIAEIKNLLLLYKDIEDGLNTSLTAMEGIKEDLNLNLAKKISAIESYLDNIIKDEGQTDTKRASKNYSELFALKRRFEQIGEDLKKADKQQTKALLTKYVYSYIEGGFFKQMIMTSNSGKKSFNFEVSNKEDAETIKANMELLKFINEIEKANVISSQYELDEKIRIREVYNTIDKIFDEDFKEVSMANRIQKILTGKWNVVKTLTDWIEHTQRLHGIFLDYFHNGRTKDEVLARSLDRFFNYGMKGAEEVTAGVFFPFVSFAVRNFDLYMDMLGDQRYVRFMTNVAQGMSTWYDDEDDDPRKSNFFTDFTENQGWFPMGRNYGIKLGNSMFDALSFTRDPVDSFRQKLNPVIQQINRVTKGETFDTNRLATVTAAKRSLGTMRNLTQGTVETPADVVPSLFYRYSQFTPYKYRRYRNDFRNIQRDLFFQDGSRRTPSLNPYTTAKNIRYQAFVNARLSRVKR